jgi:hypothetical protein
MKVIHSVALAGAMIAALATRVDAQVVVSDPVLDNVLAPRIASQQWSQYLEQVNTYKANYDQLQIMIQNAKNFSVEDWVNIGTQANQIASAIKAQQAKANGSAFVGAGMAQNTFFNQDVNVLTTIASMAPSAAGSTQRQQLTNQLLMAIASDNLKQRELRLAEAQDAARSQGVWLDLQAAQSHDTLHP